MSCTSQTLGGLPQNCEQNVGGVKKVYIANRSDVSAVALDDTSHMVKTITMESTKKFKSYGFKKGAASFTSTATIDNANGIYFVQTVVSIDFAKMETRTGAARTDANKYHIEITDESFDYPYEVDPAAIADIVEETTV